MNNKGSDKNVVTEDVNELKRLLYSDNLTQYGKRKFVSYYDKRIKELEKALLKVKDKNTTLFITCRNSIPTQVVMDKIEKNKGYLEYADTMYEYTQKDVIEECIKTLQELLEGERK